MVGKGEVKCGKRVKGEGMVEDGEKEVKVMVGNGEVKGGKREGEVKCGKRKGGRERLMVKDGERGKLRVGKKGNG
jgi:hypothetical protein